jgi:3-oxoacyl-[acyl-carrier protein] reductase
MLLRDKVALITGGAKGMGKGMALKFAEHGCSVVIADISMNEAEETISEIQNKNGKGIAVKCDVTDSSQIKAAVEKTLSDYEKIDILINNAGGIAPSPPIEEISEELWDKVFSLNLKSTFLFCKYVVPHMKSQHHGKIINLSSIGAIQPPMHAIHYNTAKSAIIGFTYDLASALAPHNINVNAIMPGPIRTSFYDARIGTMTEKEKDAFFEMLGQAVPLKRVGSMEDIADAALFLCSTMSDFITGQILKVAGGLPLSAAR